MNRNSRADSKDSVQHEQLIEQYVKEKMRDAGIEGVSKEDAVEEGGSAGHTERRGSTVHHPGRVQEGDGIGDTCTSFWSVG